MPFWLSLSLLAFSVIVAVAWNLKDTFVSSSSFQDSIEPQVEARKLEGGDWKEFYRFFLNKGFKQNEIDIVKESLQKYSRVARVMIFPEDSIYYDLKLDSVDNEDDQVMFMIFDKLGLDGYEEGNLLDSDIDSVIQVFEFIRRKQLDFKKKQNKIFV